MGSFFVRYCKLWFLLLFSVVYLGAQESEIEIRDYYAKVYLAPSEKSRYIGLAQRGERYEVIIRTDTWVRIKFKDAIGWLYSSQVGPVGSSQSNLDNQEATMPAVQDSQIQESVSTVPISTNPPPSALPVEIQTQTSDTPATVSIQQTSPTRTVTEESRQQQPAINQLRQDEKNRSWFSKKTVPQLPSAAPALEEDTAAFFFQVTFGPARVLSYLSPEAPILGMAWKGDLFPLIGEGDSWCKIMFNDSTGWIEHKYGVVVKDTDTFSFSAYLPIFIIAGVILVVIIVMVILFVVRRKKANIVTPSNMKKNVLMIAKATKTIQYTLTNTNTSLRSCFIEIGFTVLVAKDNQSIRNLLTQESPDVVLVDWNFDKNIFPSLERLFATLQESERILFIIYNVPDPTTMHPSRVLPNITFLGSIFSDRDIFKIVTPLIINENNRNLQKSSQSAALEGEIGGGNLLEVLQFIEIGRKSGCLLVETNAPFGLIYFTEGRIVYAATSNKILGRDAVFAVLDLKNGKFSFVTNKLPKVTNVNYSTLEILMEWAKAADEAHGA